LNKWFVVNTFDAYIEHPNMIGRITKSKLPIPKATLFTNIKAGDMVVYYVLGSKVVTGIFAVISNKESLGCDDIWQNTEIFKLFKLEGLKDNCFFDFKKFYNCNYSTSKPFDPFVMENNYPNIEVVIKLEDEDYEKIEEAISNPLYTKKIEIKEGNIGPTGYVPDQQMMVGLLDYYNSRSTSFASLVVASIFGLVTLSAIIQSEFSKILDLSISSSSDIGPIVISNILFILFAGAGYYTIKSYFFYAVISDKIKSYALETPYYSQLERTKWWEFKEGKFSETSLLFAIKSLTRKHGNTPIKKWMQKSYAMSGSFILSIVLLWVFIYWSLIVQYIIPIIR
jgi:hypothetical protein